MEWLKRVLIGSPLEEVARRAHRLLTGRRLDAVALKNAAYDRQTVAVMRRWLKRDSTCVDVGCNEGAVLREMLRLAPGGTHFAFEPIPGLCRKLRAEFPSVRVFDLALGDVAGESVFHHVTSNPGYSGLRRRPYDRPDEMVEEITVRVDRLDDVLPAGQRVDFVKVDVEGAELQVLRGAVATLRRTRPVVVFEHGLGAAGCYGTTPEQVHDLLVGECGLRISLMEDWLRGAAPLSREGFVAQLHGRLNYYFMAHPERG